MADLEKTARQLVNQICDEAGWSSVTADRLKDAEDWLNRGYAKFMRGYHVAGRYVHQWSFLIKQYGLSVTADDAEYDLPSDFGGLVNTPVYQHEDGEDYPVLREITMDEYNNLLEQADTDDTSDADRYALFPTTFSNTATQGYQIKFYPMFDASHTITIPYRMRSDKLTDDAIYHMGGAIHTETIFHLALAELEHDRNTPDGRWTQISERSMAESIAVDHGWYHTGDSPNVFDGRQIGLTI